MITVHSVQMRSQDKHRHILINFGDSLRTSALNMLRPLDIYIYIWYMLYTRVIRKVSDLTKI